MNESIGTLEPRAKRTKVAMADETPEKAKSPKRWLWSIVAVLALAAVAYWLLNVSLDVMTHESTDDAFIEGHVVPISPKVAAQVLKIHVADNQEVKEGELLVELDPRDYQVRLDQKRAAVTTADANSHTVRAGLDLVQARVTTAEASAHQAQAEADASAANAKRAAADLERYEQLRKGGVVSAQEYDRAREVSASAEANLRAAREKAASEASKVAEAKAQLQAARTLMEMAQAQISQTQTDVKSAELDLSYTRIYAPRAGRITRKAVESGAYVQVGQSLFTIVPADVWVVANYKETQLARMRPGEPVDIEVGAAANHHFHGHVESIQAGSGARFSLLPPENAVGNFVKVVQRVPVKIVFDDALNSGQVLGPGMSVTPEVKVAEISLGNPVRLAAAIIFSVIVVLLVQFLQARIRRRSA